MGPDVEKEDMNQRRIKKMDNKPEIMSELHCVIDVETVDRKPTAGILSIGAVTFIPNKMIEQGEIESVFYINVDIESCINLGMTFEWETIMWWFEQEKEAGEALQKNRQHIGSALDNLIRFYLKEEPIHTWGNPSKFDISILENAYSRCGLPEPWGRRSVMDLMTTETIIGSNNKNNIKESMKKQLDISGVKHNALYDAQVETYRISHALKRMTICQE